MRVTNLTPKSTEPPEEFEVTIKVRRDPNALFLWESFGEGESGGVPVELTLLHGTGFGLKVPGVEGFFVMDNQSFVEGILAKTSAKPKPKPKARRGA